MRPVAVALLALVIVGGGSPIDTDGGLDSSTDSFYGEATGESDTGGAQSSGGVARDGYRYEYRQVDCTEELSSDPSEPRCPSGYVVFVTCPGGLPPSLPVFGRWVAESSGMAEAWSLVQWYSCPDDEDFVAEVLSEWTSLSPTPSPLNLQPGTGWVYATVPTIAFTDDTPLIHSATLLGIPVRIRATPTGFAWSWGDGSVTETADAGSPYPDYSLSHTYLHFEGEVEVALETTWSGDYSVNGGPWIDIEGTITTQSGPVTVEVYDPQSRLVDCDLNNNCIVGAG